MGQMVSVNGTDGIRSGGRWYPFMVQMVSVYGADGIRLWNRRYPFMVSAGVRKNF